MKVSERVAVLTIGEELAGLARVVHPRDTAKRLARQMRSEVTTAKYWLTRGVSAQRRREAAARLLVELDRQDAEERADARRRLGEIAGDHWICGTGSQRRSGD